MKAVVGHFEIPARAPRRTGEFFSRVFGWTADPVEWDGPTYYKLRAEGEATSALQGGILEAAGAGFEHPLPVIHLTEGSLEECLARVEAAGGAVAEPAHEVGNMGRFARFRDPDGHQWGLWKSAE